MKISIKKFAQSLYAITLNQPTEKLESNMRAFVTYIYKSNLASQFPQIIEEFKKYYHQKKNEKNIIITSKYPLSAEQKNQLTEKLQKLFKNKIILSYQNNPNLYGGLTARGEDFLIDLSLKRKIANLKNNLTK